MKKYLLFLLLLIFFVSFNFVSANCIGGIIVDNEIERSGITWTFDQSYQCGQYINGDYWVLDSGSGVNVISVNPVPSGSGEDFIHGSVINPLGGSSQGYHGDLDGYDSTLSVSFPVLLFADDSLVSTEARDSYSDCSVSTRDGVEDIIGYCVELRHVDLKRASVLSVVGSTPLENSFRPPFSGPDKPKFNFDNVNLDLLPRLSTEGLENIPTIEEFNNYVDYSSNLWLDHKGGWTGRPMHPYLNMPNYGREIGAFTSEISMLLMLDYPDSNLEELAINYIQIGIDLYYMAQNGASWSNQGGHGNGRKWPIKFAGYLLNNSDMLYMLPGDQYSDVRFAEDEMTYYGVEGKPLWGSHISHVSEYLPPTCDADSGAKEYRDPNGLLDGCPDYRECCTSRTWVGAAMSALILDLKHEWNYSSFFDYMDRWVRQEYDGYSRNLGGSSSNLISSIWAEYRDDYGCIYVDHDSNTATRNYNCSDTLVQCSAISVCDDYPNQRACDYDPCGLGCNGNCQYTPIEPTCSDGIQNQDETGIDCGGICNACPIETCDDEIQNQDETGIDCGGVCPACPVIETCNDGIQNQDETDIDCGGVCSSCETNLTTIFNNCLDSHGAFQNMNLSQNYTENFNISFNITPMDSSIDGFSGLSQNIGSLWNQYAAIILFNTDGNIVARNASSYTSDINLTYNSGTVYNVRMDVNIDNKTYDVYVSYDEFFEIQIANDYTFRTEQIGTTEFNYLGVISTVGSHELCGFNELINNNDNSNDIIHEADSDESGDISLTELNAYINSWRSSNTVTLANLIEAISLWKD